MLKIELLLMQLQWGSESGHSKSRLFKDPNSNGPVFNRSGFSYNPNNLKTEPFKTFMLLSGFQMVFNKMAAISPDFKWSGF